MEEPSGNDGAINDSVRKLIKEGFKDRIPASYIQELQRKYNDQALVDKIQDVYYEKVTDIRRRAIKFTKLIERKYGAMGYPLHVVLNKALKYKTKYSLSDAEFEMFRQLYEKTMNPRNRPGMVSVLAPNTNMAKVFGDVNSTEKGLNVGENDLKVVREIIANYEVHRRLHAQICLQSVTYPEARAISDTMGAKYNKATDNINSPVHPILAAMFLPKFAIFERHFLHSNLGYIVKQKHTGDDTGNSYPNYMLLHSLVHDPTDVVCSNESPLVDIRNRASLQIAIWNCVLGMRNGKFYDTGVETFNAIFMNNIDNCKISNYDAPDLLYYGDETVVMRRIMNAFSLRPTIVSTFPLSGYQTHNQINFPVMINSVTAVPMLHVRLPVMASPNMGPAVVRFADSLSQPSFMVENGVFTARNQQVIYSEDVIIFNVPRRTYHPLMNVQNMFKPTNYSNLPQNLVGLEKMNAFPVEPLGFGSLIGTKQTAELVSVVALDVSKQDTSDELIKGSVTIFTTEGMTYNPVVVAGNNDVITANSDIEITTNGVIFIYRVKAVSA